MAINRILGTLAALLLLSACDSEPEEPPSIYEGINIATAFARLQPHVLNDFLSQIDTTKLAEYRYDSDSNIVHSATVNRFHTYAVRIAINYGADINYQNSYGSTPLHRAIYHNNAHAVGILMQMGARTDLVNKSGYTATMNCELLLKEDQSHRACNTFYHNKIK